MFAKLQTGQKKLQIPVLPNPIQTVKLGGRLPNMGGQQNIVGQRVVRVPNIGGQRVVRVPDIAGQKVVRGPNNIELQGIKVPQFVGQQLGRHPNTLGHHVVREPNIPDKQLLRGHQVLKGPDKTGQQVIMVPKLVGKQLVRGSNLVGHQVVRPLVVRSSNTVGQQVVRLPNIVGQQVVRLPNIVGQQVVRSSYTMGQQVGGQLVAKSSNTEGQQVVRPPNVGQQVVRQPNIGGRQVKISGMAGQRVVSQPNIVGQQMARGSDIMKQLTGRGPNMVGKQLVRGANSVQFRVINVPSSQTITAASLNSLQTTLDSASEIPSPPVGSSLSTETMEFEEINGDYGTIAESPIPESGQQINQASHMSEQANPHTERSKPTSKPSNTKVKKSMKKRKFASDDEEESNGGKKKSMNLKEREAVVKQKFISNMKEKRTAKFKYWECCLCQKVFTTHDNAMYHVSLPDCTSTGKKKGRVSTCYICDMVFPSKKAINQHYNQVHNESLTCSRCPNAEFRDEASLKRHLDCVHGDKKFACSECGKKFNRKDSLVRHVRIHQKDEYTNPFFQSEEEDSDQTREFDNTVEDTGGFVNPFFSDHEMD